jgi:undecaprenyl-diphosphatase
VEAKKMIIALLLGIVEGLTEFLPVSSTGHLILASEFLQVRGEQAIRFIIVIQIGAILAVVWEFRRPLVQFSKESWHRPFGSHFFLKLAVAFLPVAGFGLLVHSSIEELFFNPTSVAWALIAGGIAIIIVERVSPRFEVTEVEKVTWRHSLLIGVAQVSSLIPGVSRSGATIMGGLLVGLNRRAATEFSFYLAIPTMFAAGFYDLFKEWPKTESWDPPFLIMGFLTSFLSALIILRPFTRYVQSHTFLVFAYYRIIFGGLLHARTYLLT